MSMPTWARTLPWDAINAAAARHALDPKLVAAVVQTESAGQAFATRYEKAYRWHVTPDVFARDLGITLETEVIAQSHSYGLMQIMGGTARGLGFKGYCVELVDVELGLEYGCRCLAHCVDRWRPLEHGIAAYNAGSPRDVAPKDGVLDNFPYVEKVLKRLDELRGTGKDLA